MGCCLIFSLSLALFLRYFCRYTKAIRVINTLIQKSEKYLDPLKNRIRKNYIKKKYSPEINNRQGHITGLGNV